MPFPIYLFQAFAEWKKTDSYSLVPDMTMAKQAHRQVINIYTHKYNVLHRS